MSPLNTKVSSLKGHIDIFDAGAVRGWVFDPEHATKSTSFFLAIDGRIVSVGFACLFRADLKEAGYSNGHHAFSLVLDLGREFFGKRVISILDKQHRVIHNKEVDLGESFDTPSIDLISSQNNTLEFIYKPVNPADNSEFCLYEDNVAVWMGRVKFETQGSRFYLPLPLALIDGREHTLSIGISGFIPLLWSGVVSMAVPAYSKNNISGLLADHSDDGQGSRFSHRYKSLSRQLEHLQNLDHIDSIRQAHKFMLEGCASNVDLPWLKIPDSVNTKVSVFVTSTHDIKALFHLLASFVLSFETYTVDLNVLIDSSLTENQTELSRLEGISLVVRDEALPIGRQITDVALSQGNEFVLLCGGLHESCSGLISHLVDHFRDEDVGAVGARLLSGDGRIWESGIQFNGDNSLEIAGIGKSWLDPEMAVAVNCSSFLDAPVCFRTRDLAHYAAQLKDIQNVDEFVYKVCTLLSASGRLVQAEPQAVGFTFPNPKRILEQKLLRLEQLNSLHAQADNYPVTASGKQIPKKRIMMFDVTTPTPDRDAGSYAAIQEIKLLISLGFDITFVPLDLQYKIKYTSRLQALGVEVLYQPFYRQIGDIILQKMPTISGVYITRYNVAEQFIDTLKSAFPEVPIIFNNADLHFLREIRTALTSNSKTLLDKALETRHDELEIINKVDAVLSYTETEQAVITSHVLRNNNLFKCPWVLEQKSQGLAFSDRQGIAFLGGFKHLPNVQAVDFIVNQVMPLLKMGSPDIKLRIYGSNMPDRFSEYQSDNVELLGFVDNLEEVFDHCRIFVAPLLAGAGIKGKVLEAMAFGVPCVLSGVAAEGTGLTHGLTTMIADQPEEWASCITSLYNDEHQWDRIVENQQILVKNQYSFEHGQNDMKRILSSVGLY